MRKTVFANFGVAEQGKSETIKMIAQEILNAYPSARTSPVQINYLSDIQVIITINQIKIGVESQGDPNSRLLESLNKFSNANCDIIICSTRTSGETVNAVKSLNINSGYEIVWVTNHRSNQKSHAILNDISAKHIFSLVQQVMAGTL